ncbi:cytochrome b [Coraliomargarita parva]|uniref:cytochrome b n=1 Tax=Coraliomargarita parva TaxID=3014050 RepID=UPI0022B4D064|nr:cytochrome bc complex cytochrome b subunit [Coraliomargarita parva]
MNKTSLRKWLAERFDREGLKSLFEKQLRKPLPKNIGWFHTLGSLSLFLFLSQCITGVLLLVYYRATVNEAFESVKYIVTEAYMGWLIRQVHAWGANLMVVAVFLHMLRTYVTGSYKKPRELTWVSGVGLLVFTLAFGFTGYLLPWNQVAFWATTVGTEVAGSIPFVGDWIKTFLRGGTDVGGETLSRFFVVHVIVLPWLLFFLIAFHLSLVRLQGIATMQPHAKERLLSKSKGIPFFPHHVTKEAVVLFFLLGILISLAVLVPFDLGEKANPLETPHAIKPEWYFLPMYQAIKYFPEWVGILMLGLAPLALLLWPFLDRNPERHPRKRPIAMALAFVIVLSLLVFGILGYLSESRQSFLGRTYEFDIYGIPHAVPDDTSDASD